MGVGVVEDVVVDSVAEFAWEAEERRLRFVSSFAFFYRLAFG